MNGPELPDPADPDKVDDGLDELLRTRVQAAIDTPRSPDAHEELRELGPRFRRARRRRQAAVATMSSAAAVLLLVVGAFVLGGEDVQRVDTAGEDRARTTSTVESPTSSTTTTSTSTTVPSTVTSLAPDDATEGGRGGVGQGGVQPAPTTTAAPPVSEAPAPSTPTGGQQVLSATGGSATVRWDATSITVLRTTPAPGWALEQVEQQSPTRVVVKFRREEGGTGSRTSAIDARVVDGRLDVSS